MKIPLFKNTVTNYLSAAVRLVQGILLSRWMIGYLGMESYGLWTLLWSFFGYALLLDFGCGASAQKYTSGALYEKDPRHYSRLMSTIFTFHAATALVIALAGFGASFWLEWILNIHDPDKLSYARNCFLMFAGGAALLFPTGIFPEILVGLQHLYLRNYIIVAVKILELAGTLAILGLGGGLFSLIVFTSATMLTTNLAMAFATKKLLPEFHLRPGWDRASLREIVSFSAFVYIEMVSRIVLNKSSRLLISIFCGVTQVGVFQLAGRIAELCLQTVSQYQENISPLSGALHKRGKYRVLGRIIAESMRWNSFVAGGAMLLAYLLIDPLLLALFKVRDPYVSELSGYFLLSMYLTAAARNIPQRFMMMSDRHKFASAVTIFEAAANLVLNLLLLKPFGMEVVIWNSLVLKVLASFGVMLPYTLSALRIPPAKFLLHTFAEPLLAGTPVVALFYFTRDIMPSSPWMQILLWGGMGGVIYLAMTALFAGARTRRYVLGKVRELLGRRA